MPPVHHGRDAFFQSKRGPRIRLWDVVSGKMLAELQGHEGDITSLAFSADGKK
jgi:WD40 repeat protein